MIELADSSEQYELLRKAALYARASIPEYWVISRNRQALVVHRAPAMTQYVNIMEYKRGETVNPLAFPDEQFAVDDLLGAG